MQKIFSFKIKLIAVISCVILCALAITGVFAVKTFNESKVLTVVIDAGHGGIDGGASGVNTGVRESDINLLIAKELKKHYENAGFNVVMVRESDVGLYGDESKGFKLRDLEKRVEIINGCGGDFLVSVHLNVYSSPSRRGAQAFYKKGDKHGEILAKKIQGRINGLGVVPRLYDALHGDYYLLNNSKIPSVIVECGFLSSPEDEKLLISSSYREQIASAIYSGSLDALVSFN
ncbi:MAG: N-acetylmuramoyl-L-alanine amidase [Clostridia bacterium]|nr:N-acetylmuramoyl-L-alanine amidase [Clostridia bacterium]